MPTAIVVSGNGIHVVYMLDEPIPTYPETLDALSDLKAILSRKLWNEKTSTDSKIQYQGITQGYRMVGTKTKRGHITRAFKVGNKVSIDELLSVLENISEYPLGKKERKSKTFSKRILKCLKNRNLYKEMTQTLCDDITHVSLEEAKVKWPDWYEKRIVNKEAPGHYICGKGLYTWWLEMISSKENVHVGNRRNCMATVNNYESEYVNGDIGIIKSCNSKSFTVDFSGRSVVVDKAQKDDFQLAYATTIHKSQGSQYDTVIICLPKDSDGMMYRNLLYTAITRAQKQVFLYSAEGNVEKAAERTISDRISDLDEMFNKKSL